MTLEALTRRVEKLEEAAKDKPEPAKEEPTCSPEFAKAMRKWWDKKDAPRIDDWLTAHTAKPPMTARELCEWAEQGFDNEEPTKDERELVASLRAKVEESER